MQNIWEVIERKRGGEKKTSPEGSAYSLLLHGRQPFNPIKQKGEFDSLIGICLV